MKAKYLIRFDDICPTMNWSVWAGVEEILLQNEVKPILAVVPDNQDPKLIVDPPAVDFWARVRLWQQNGWTIALHGYQHVYQTPGSGLVGLNCRSEFVGLSYDEQYKKLSRALEIFRQENVHIDTFVAPAHSFDVVTINALKDLGIKIISDGFYLRPVVSMGAIFVPQQLWRLRSMLFGVWTVCYHANCFSAENISSFKKDILFYKKSITSMKSVIAGHQQVKPIGLFDVLFSKLFLFCLKFKAKLKSLYSLVVRRSAQA